MSTIEQLRQELEDATQAANAAPRGVNEWPRVNEVRRRLDAAIEAAKTPEQKQIESLTEQIGTLERKVSSLGDGLSAAHQVNAELRRLIGLHTGKPTDKPIGLLAMDLARIRASEDQLAMFVRTGDMEGALRVCINRGLPRARPESLTEAVKQIGLAGHES